MTQQNPTLPYACGQLFVTLPNQTEEIEYRFNLSREGQAFYTKTMWWALHNAESIRIVPSADWKNKAKNMARAETNQ